MNDDFEKIANIQESLYDLPTLNEAEYSSFVNNLINSPLLKQKTTFRSVLVSIYSSGILTRPHDFDLYLDLFLKIATLPCSYFTSDDYTRNFTSSNYFKYKLYQNKLINIETLYGEAYRNKTVMEYFYPELKESYPEFIEEMAKLDKKHYINDDSDIETFKKLRDIGRNHDPICPIIFNDDINEFTSMVSTKNIDIEKYLNYSLFESCLMVNSMSSMPTLIEYAAFFGSCQIFKYLYMNLSQLPQGVAKFACAGGNYEIIHLCEYKKASFSGCLETAIYFFRNDLARYVEEVCNCQKSIDSVSKSLVYYNLHGLISHYQILQRNINAKDEKGFTPLSLAALNGDLDIVKYLVTTFRDTININEPNDDSNKPLFFAAQNGHLDVVMYLTSLEDIQLNAMNYQGFTALHAAVGKNHFHVVKYLCSLKGIDLNADCNKNYRPIDYAITHRYVKIAEYLRNQNGVVFFQRKDHCLTIMSYAILTKNLSIVQYVFNLIKDEIDPNGHEEVNLLIYAKDNCSQEIQDFLQDIFEAQRKKKKLKRK